MPEHIKNEMPSGFRTLLGYRLAEWRDGFAIIEIDIDNRHLNRSGVVHGGVYATLIDAAGGYAGCFSGMPGPARRAFTLSLNTNFIGTTRSGILRAIARKTGGGARIFFASIEVVDQVGAVLATGEGTYRLRGEKTHGPTQ